MLAKFWKIKSKHVLISKIPYKNKDQKISIVEKSKFAIFQLDIWSLFIYNFDNN